MRRFLSTSFIVLTLVISAAGAAPVAHAADIPSGGDCTSNPSGCVSGTTCVDIGNGSASFCQPPGGGGGGTAVDKAAANTPTPFEGSPPMDSAFAKVMNMILSLFAWLLTAAMITLNYAVYYTVIKMGDYVNGLAAVGVTWRILRDIANIMFIFGFLGAGIATILNVDQYGWKTKMLPMLLVGAVFLNFSLFITEAMIDTTNLVATQFYTQINGGTMPTKDTLLNEGISGKIMQQLGFQSIYDVQKAPDVLTAKNSLFVAFMGIILFIVTAFVMFSLAFILIARFVALIFFIILCPVGFMGLAIPWMQYRAGQWWKNFLDQIITAPVLLLLLYVALAVITDAQFLAFGSSPNWLGLNPYSSTPANMAGFAGMLLSFLIAMGLLLVVVIKAKSMSAFGAGMAIKAGAAASFGATAYGMSALAGGGAFGLRKGLQRYAPNSRTARAISNYALRPLERAKFDVRSVGVGKALGAIGVSDASVPIGASAVGRAKQGTEWLKKTGQEADRQYQQETVVPRLNAAVQGAIQTGDYRQVSNILGSMSDKDFETRSAQRALLDNPIAAALLPQARFEKIQQSEAISEARKAEIAQARRNGDDPTHAQSRFNMDAATRYGPTLPGGAPHPFAGMTRGEALISTMNTTTRGRLGGNVLTENTAPVGAPPVYIPRPATLNLLNGSDFDAIRRTGELAPAQRDAVGTYIDALIAGAPPVPTPRQASIIAAAAAPVFRSYYNLP